MKTGQIADADIAQRVAVIGQCRARNLVFWAGESRTAANTETPS